MRVLHIQMTSGACSLLGEQFCQTVQINSLNPVTHRIAIIAGMDDEAACGLQVFPCLDEAPIDPARQAALDFDQP